MPAKHKDWTRDEHILAFNLYFGLNWLAGWLRGPSDSAPTEVSTGYWADKGARDKLPIA